MGLEKIMPPPAPTDLSLLLLSREQDVTMVGDNRYSCKFLCSFINKEDTPSAVLLLVNYW